MKISKKIICVHSGGMDSSLCLLMALEEYKAEDILSLGFSYNQRHGEELERAAVIAQKFAIDRYVLDIACLSEITSDALTSSKEKIALDENGVNNTLVVGRNGLMARLAAIHAHSLGAKKISMGVIGVESACSGYRDCSRDYMDLMEQILRIDLDQHDFKILTPVVHLTKYETMEEGHRLGSLEFLLETTITCYEGISKIGCKKCPACLLRNEGIKEFLLKNPDFHFSYKDQILALP